MLTPLILFHIAYIDFFMYREFFFLIIKTKFNITYKKKINLGKENKWGLFLLFTFW